MDPRFAPIVLEPGSPAWFVVFEVLSGFVEDNAEHIENMTDDHMSTEREIAKAKKIRHSLRAFDTESCPRVQGPRPCHVVEVYLRPRETAMAVKSDLSWLRAIEALKPGDPCEFRWPACAAWHAGVVVENGGSHYWAVRLTESYTNEETGAEVRAGQVARSIAGKQCKGGLVLLLVAAGRSGATQNCQRILDFPAYANAIFQQVALIRLVLWKH